MSNSFTRGMNQLKKHDTNLDQFAIDLHFFQRSSVWREDFKELSSITNVHFNLSCNIVKRNGSALKKFYLELLNSLVS